MSTHVSTSISSTDSDNLCGEMLFGPEGTIQSADRDDNGQYDSNSECYWILVAPASKTVRIEFLSIAIEASSDCSYDFIAVCTGFYEKPCFRLCSLLPCGHLLGKD